MIYGLYLSAQGADTQSVRVDTVSNNLANASTGAFKRDLAVFQAHRPFDVQHGRAGEVPGNLNASTGGVTLADVITDFSDGSLKATGGTYDVALSGPGFLRVSDGTQQFLTRNGRFTVNTEGELVTHDLGHSVLGVGGGPITIPAEATDVEITQDGRLFQIGPDNARSELGQLDLVQPESFEEITKLGNSFYRAEGNVSPADENLVVRQGFLEESGTRPVSEMMELIEASRALEANMNLVRLQDETLGNLLQAIPRR